MASKPLTKPDEGTQLVAKPSGKPGQYKAIEGLRTIMALMVIICHLQKKKVTNQDLNSEAPLKQWFDCLFPLGFFPVDTFFIIAGFVTELPGRDAPATGAAKLRYCANRFVRLAPVFYTAVLLHLVWQLVASAQDCTAAVRRAILGLESAILG